MTQPTLLVVALPNGISASGALRLSLYITPRLPTAGTLADYPDIAGWTALVASKGLTVTIVCGGLTTAVAVPRAGLRPDLWQAIFKPDAPVAPYPRPSAERPLVVSYPVMAVHDFVRGAYRTAAQRPSSLAKNGNFSRGEGSLLGDLLGNLAFRDAKGSTIDGAISDGRVALWRQQRRRIGAPTNDAAAPDPLPVREAATRFAMFHRPPASTGSAPLPATPAEFSKTIDFHQALAALAAHPALLRALGLVFDIDLPAGVAASPDASGNTATVGISAVTPGWNWSVAPTLSLPATAYVRDTTRFTAAPASSPAQIAAGDRQPGDVEEGFVVLSPDLYGVIGVDLDGAMLKAMTLADNYAAINDRSRVEQVLPSLRSGGLSLIANDRALDLLRAIDDQTALHTAEDGTRPFDRPFDARDLVRGYRLDVWSSLDDTWRSLHRRDGSYRVGDAGLVLTTSDEEGFTQLAVTRPPADPNRAPDATATAAGAPQPDGDIFLHERIARWHGWSLSAPRPGRPLNRSGDPLRATDDDPTAGTAVTPFAMTTTFTARPGTLPRLRFGARYRLRARAVDLAGNSPPPDSATPDEVAAPPTAVAYHRFEPVSSPVVVPRQPPGTGGSTLCLVIRSRNTSVALDTVPTDEIDERHLFPPKSDVLTVEHHGMLDDSRTVRGDRATYDLIVARDKGVIAPEGEPLIDPAKQAICPWFPDPIARGIALAGLPGAPDNALGTESGGTLVYIPRSPLETPTATMTHVNFAGDWPDRAPARLVIDEGNAAPAWDAAARALTVGLPKATIVEVPISCFMSASDLELMGVWDWMRAAFESAETAAFTTPTFGGPVAGDNVVRATQSQADLTRLALEGGHEMLTPPERVVLVHATQQPLGRPKFVTLPIDRSAAAPRAPGDAYSPITAWRSVGSHEAVLLGALGIHGASTAQIDLDAGWTDVIDDPGQPGPTTRPGSAHVSKIELRTLDAGLVPADASGLAHVADYLAPIDTLWFAMPTDRLQGVDSPVALAAPAHVFGDTLRRQVGYRAVATSRFAEHFSGSGLDFTRASDRLVVDVPSSARPSAPKVLYVLPTFGWDRQQTTNIKTVTRQGNGLRVYLDRPWYSSGVGELLGVVLWAGGSEPDDAAREKYRAYFTQWGLDPLWAGGSLFDTPRDISFPSATETGVNLSLDGTDITVEAMGHSVAYDAERRLWFCDIDFSYAYGYTPFVRLALARYQPGSIAGAELSHVVLADVAQLTPDRSASLVVDPSDPRTGRLFVAGRGPTAPAASLIEVTVERHDSHLGGDLAWSPAPVDEVSVAADASGAPTESSLWSGSIVFSADPAVQTYRVVVREFELHPADPAPGDIVDSGIYAERIVYAAIIDWSF